MNSFLNNLNKPDVRPTNIRRFNYKNLIILLSLLVACYFVFFFNLGSTSINRWDESRIAINALEMTLNGNWVVTHFDRQPDLWNTKPPFFIWWVALSMKLFGYNEFALRFPSAIAALATTIIIFYFGKNYFNDLKIGLCSALVLITSTGYVGEHVARTGDYDAMLVLWITIYSLILFSYLESINKKNIYLVIATISLILAVLTKSIAGVLVSPGILIYAAIQKKLKQLLFNRQSLLLLGCFLGAIAGYYLIREYLGSGYIQAVIKNEFTGRYLNVIENNDRPFLFYLKDLRKTFFPWIYILFFCVVITYFSHNYRVKKFTIFGAVYLSCFLLVISFAQTKLPWYNAPFYPITSLIIGLGISDFLNFLIKISRIKKSYYRQLFCTIVIFLIFSKPYYNLTYKKIVNNDGKIFWEQTQEIYRYKDYLNQLAQVKPKLTQYSIIQDKALTPVKFYIKTYNLKGYLIKQKSTKNQLVDNEVAVTCISTIATQLKNKYNLKILHQDSPCYTFLVEDAT
jgi:4-amino-4-deoxy-L-arabinose transferase-like glycosyltransferase